MLRSNPRPYKKRQQALPCGPHSGLPPHCFDAHLLLAALVLFLPLALYVQGSPLLRMNVCLFPLGK